MLLMLECNYTLFQFILSIWEPESWMLERSSSQRIFWTMIMQHISYLPIWYLKCSVISIQCLTSWKCPFTCKTERQCNFQHCQGICGKLTCLPQLLRKLIGESQWWRASKITASTLNWLWKQFCALSHCWQRELLSGRQHCLGQEQQIRHFTQAWPCMCREMRWQSGLKWTICNKGLFCFNADRENWEIVMISSVIYNVLLSSLLYKMAFPLLAVTSHSPLLGH